MNRASRVVFHLFVCSSSSPLPLRSLDSLFFPVKPTVHLIKAETNRLTSVQNTDETYCYIRIKHGKAKMTTRRKMKKDDSYKRKQVSSLIAV